LLSRHPIVWSQVHDLNGFALIDALVQTPSGLLRVYVAHLASPKTPGQTAIRRQQLDQLGLLLRDSAEPVLLLGDLNLSTISPHWQRFAADANLLRPASAPTGTWPSWLGALGADIDHIAGRRLGIGAVSAFAIPGSDHRGVMATISLP
jgi:vancomycin resistance protein VanJ